MASEVPRVVLAAVLLAALGVAACAGRQRPITQTERIESAEGAPMLQFDNQATEHVDVYLVSRQLQWRLGRVPPGMRAMLRVPEAALDEALGFVQLTVIPGSQMSAQASRDPRAILASAQPVSEVLSHRWTFRQSAGAALQLQATALRGRQ